MSWESLIAQYVEHLRTLNRAASTVTMAATWVPRFAAACARWGVEEPVAVTAEHVARYRQELMWQAGPDGALYSQSTVDIALRRVRGFFRWMREHQALLVDPMEHLVLGRVPRLIRRVPTVDEALRLLATPAEDTPEGLRDRAVLEVLYSAGLRRAECHGLDLADLDLEARTLRVRGKGGAERLAPVGESLAAALDLYLREGRPKLVGGRKRPWHRSHPYCPRATANEPALFLSQMGTRFSLQGVYLVVKHAARRAGVPDTSTHCLRHAFGTHLLEGGAALPEVGALLGHKCRQATEVYTHVSFEELARVHRETHPRARRLSPPAAGA